MYHLFKSRSRTILIICLVALLVLVSLVASGCSPAAPEEGDGDTGVKAVEEMVIGVSFPSLMSGTWQATEENLLAYQEELGFELIETVADNDANKQLSQIEDMIAQGVDAIIVDPIDSKAIMAAIRAANDADIPIILFDRPPADMEGVASFVGSDNYAFGQEAARQLATFAEKSGVELKVLVLIGALTDENAVNRNDGFQEVAAELGIEIVTEVPTDWKTEKALDGVTNALQANPEINAIFIPSDYLLPSVLSALKTSDRLFCYGEEGHIMLAQIDGDGNGAKSLQDGYSVVDIAHDPVAWAQKPIDNAITLIQGGEVDPVFDALPGVVGTVENILELGSAFWGNLFVEGAEPADGDAGVKAVEEMVIGVSFPSLMSGTWQATEENLLAYQEELGFELIETVADNDANKQLSQIEDMIAQGVDAIIVDPIDSKAILAAIRAANDAGIPIILFDRPPADMEGVASFVGSDNYAFGQEAARQLAIFAEKSGVELKVLVLIGALTDENAVNRNDGFQEVAAELGIEIVTEVPTDWKTEKALDGVTNALQANPEINAIFIPSDYLLPSVLSALKTSDRLFIYGEEGHIMLAQIDGDGNGAKSLQDGYSVVDIAHDPVAWAQKPIDNAITLIQGGEVDPVFDALPGVVGTVENILELGSAFWGNLFVDD